MTPHELSLIRGNYQTILDLWAKWRPVIDEAINNAIEDLPESKSINAAKYITEGGKRFRGFLVLLVAHTLGSDPYKAIPAATAVEIVHAASLALDDIIDSDLVRRGKPAAWIELGIQKTVMVSNLLVPFAQKIIAENYGHTALAKTVRAWLDVARGEVLDAFIEPENIKPQEYYTIARLKTGALFRLACELGVITASKTGTKIEEKLSEFGEILGLVYQIADDIVDIHRLEEKEIELQDLSPATKLFYTIHNTTDKALEELATLLERARTIIPNEDSFLLLKTIPYFMADAMLREAGLRIPNN